MLTPTIALLSSLSVLSPQAEPLAPDVSRSRIANQPVGGVLRGVSFRPTRVELVKLGTNVARSEGRITDEADNYVLRFRSGKDFSPDAEVEVWFLVDKGAPLAPRVWQWKPLAFGTEEARKRSFPVRKPSSVGRGISMVMIGGKKLPKDSEGGLFNDRFSAHLRFESFKGGVLTGQIALVVPDKTQSYLNGRFRATLEKQ